MADNNSTATATQEDVAAIETSQPERTEATAPAQAPMQSRPKGGPTDLLPDMQASEVEASDKEVANGRAYEISYIVVANNPEAIESTQNRVKALVEGAEGAVDNVRVSEVRRLAYPINKRAEGVYVIINARFESTLTEELDRFFKLDETVLRHMILREN